MGITEVSNEKVGLQIFQNYPNPVKDQTIITMYVPEKDKVGLIISDMLGSYKTEPQLKSENGWYGNGNGIDSHGFTGLPGGYRCLTGGLSRIGEFAYFLSSTDSSSWGAFYRLLFRNDAIVLRGINNRYKSLCVHCVRNGLLPVVSCY